MCVLLVTIEQTQLPELLTAAPPVGASLPPCSSECGKELQLSWRQFIAQLHEFLITCPPCSLHGRTQPP